MPRTPRGGVSARPRKDGRWAGSISLGLVDGKRLRRWVYGATKAEAEDKLDALRAEVRQGRREPPSRQKLSDYLEEWLKLRKADLRATTWDTYESNLRMHVVPVIGSMPLASIRHADVQRVYQRMSAQGAAPASVHHVHSVLHRALEQAVIWERIPSNPATHTIRPAATESKRHALTVEEVGRVLAAVRGEPDEPAVVLLFATGLRRSELFGLRWSDVDWSGSLRVERALTAYHGLGPTKSRRSRRVPLGATAIAALRRQQELLAADRATAGKSWREHDLIFPDDFGHPSYHLQWGMRRWPVILDRAGVRRITLHEARHTAATLMLEAGVSPLAVAAVLGHAKATLVLEVYGHVTESMESRASEALEHAVSGR